MVLGAVTTRLRVTARSLRTRIATPTPADDSVLDHYVAGRPTPQHVADLFAGEWSTRFPADSGVVTDPGNAELFGDGRLAWGLEQLGGVDGRTVVELGPLEGAHTAMLEAGGASRIDAIEANNRAFLRCLCTKEILGLRTARFHLGDFSAFLREDRPDERYDVAVASGVLYHVLDPVGVLELLGRRADRLYLWTHYFDADLVAGSLADAGRFGPLRRTVVDDVEYEYAEQRYRTLLDWRGFCGGSAAGSRWLTLDSLERAIRRAGFTELTWGVHEPHNPHGPSIAVCARR